ncbi:HNH endonuclease [Oceanihabitans sp. 2_MG-2023]|uniref:HNH endonuclease n=1 Tax=Oceanihabitans sp. 2_MG-2023 TaxID=3062661 RepID=UPI0026E40930|nr:HNH endonuclease [Oceanihabitans sp. 2_MG-2023]MDO6596577.1 HNH endonuclease [Oceanihabitans sp. 2_MG-2023]
MLTKLSGEHWQTISKDTWRTNEKYHISSLGRIYSEKHQQLKLNFKCSEINGYEAFSAIKKNKKTNLVYVHRIMAELFIENPENKPFVIHKDFNKKNNVVSNLAWATRQEVTTHNLKNPLVIKSKIKRKENHKHFKLSEGKVKMIKRKLFDPNRKTRMRLIAKQFGISEMQLYRIKSGENWGHVTEF